ncbi:inositol 2-dehydrogenase [Cohnella thermotolerans]|uniref:inositol 2-dehydrogenase n=1 Tax=Cohnella thermotolerans TaxID=329858 RepID=UPI0004203422|nr:inositol 2-dehydrogenase [Cohnella thermotolerans]
MSKVRIGIVGAGRIGKLHAENLRQFKDVEIRAISDIFADQARGWAAQNGIERVTEDYRDILSDPDIDAILICSPTDTHVDIIKEAANAGKHIFCEKPISLDLSKTVQVLQWVKQAGIKFQLGFNRRFDHNMSRVNELLKAGKAGELHILKITSRDPAAPPESYIRSSGGLFADMAIHDFDLARFLTGSDVEEVYVQGAVRVDPVFAECGDIDTAVTTLKFKNGVLGVVVNSRQAHYYDQRVEAFGSAGTIAIQNDTPSTVEWFSSAGGVRRETPLYFFLERYKEAYVKEMRCFVDAVLNDEQVPVDVNDGYQAELIAFAAGISLREKRPVLLAEAEARLAQEV